MVLYHGTYKIIEHIDLNIGNARTDFGKGFYMGSNLGLARQWADGKAGFSGTATVMRYTVNDAVLHDECVNPLRFQSPTKEWLDFVKDNRRINPEGTDTSEPRHSHGAVSGPIANARANIVVSEYCSGKITADEALKRIRTIKSVFQLSLHTPLALSYIETVDYQQRTKSGKWGKWKRFQVSDSATL